MASPRAVRGVAAVFAATLALLPLAADAADGAAIFAEICSACHQPNGEGAPGIAPSLHSSVWQRLGDKAPQYVAMVLLNGLTGKLEVDGEVFTTGMPTQVALDDEHLSAVANHVLKTFNNLPGETTPAQFAALRATPKKSAEIKAFRAGAGP